jgi:hypothetical protein
MRIVGRLEEDIKWDALPAMRPCRLRLTLALTLALALPQAAASLPR